MLKVMDQTIEIKEYDRKLEGPKAEPGSALPTMKPSTIKRTPVAPKVKSLLKFKRPRVTLRFPFRAKVVLHKNGKYVMGQAQNISKSGIFVSATQQVFNENEVVRLYIKPFGTSKYYKSIARVIRVGDTPSRGYGLRFIPPAA
jgi:hypothetical protein